MTLIVPNWFLSVSNGLNNPNRDQSTANVCTSASHCPTNRIWDGDSFNQLLMVLWLSSLTPSVETPFASAPTNFRSYKTSVSEWTFIERNHRNKKSKVQQLVVVQECKSLVNVSDKVTKTKIPRSELIRGSGPQIFRK